ncbi:MAG: hypothetical protein CBD27_09895 [Rhodospirillaceae bacterium TMED167]|nr:hypothetical protein [Rhodospirillaceae bacterium]OUW25121.1 MAG: hypothetical protein CBD27_09895 [Rhodospirillaceae bacterium TMED167]
MFQRIKHLIYLTIGIFVVADIALHLQLPGSGSLFGKLTRERAAPAPEEGKDQSRLPQPLKRQRGPRIWVDATDHWASGSAVSKRDEFPDYYVPLPQTSLIRERRGNPKTTVGSALAIAPNGVWLTARHVVEGCQEVIVQGGLKNGRPAHLRNTKVTLHRAADVAVIRSSPTDHDRTPFVLAARGDTAGEAFHIGFPRGKPGAVHSRFLGRQQVRRPRRSEGSESVLVWAEMSRIPNFSGALGGISGGVVVDRTGAIIGTNSAGSARRGRLLTSRPETLRDIVRQSGETVATAPKTRPMIADLNSKSYPAFAKSAIQGRRVVRVICKRKV